ncbi:MAG: ATP synthase F1 subunit gamma [Thermotogaceae bacterium]|nr:ATP synthase F1 subunit gamma [Thermotogaceae bacterium]
MSRGKLRVIKNRIQSTASLMKITRAMEMVARARVRKLESGFAKVKKFFAEVENMKEKIDLSNNESVFATGEGNPVLIVISSDMGLCGAFNSEILREAERAMDSLKNIDGVIPVGAKACARFQENAKIITSYQRVYETPTFDFAASLVEEIEKISGNIHIVYGKFVNRLAQRPEIVRITPVNNEGNVSRYEYEPENVSEAFLKFYVASKIFSLLYETKVSEMYARQNAMRNATENAKDMIQTLTLEYNKARQASITQELIEIVSGSDALKEE